MADEQTKKRKSSRDLELYAIREIMKTENGRSFMWRCLENCCTFEDTFNSDPALHACNSACEWS